MYEHAQQCGVIVNAYSDSGILLGHGSGVLISSNGMVITARHVALISDNLKVVLYNGEEFPVKNKTVDPDDDIAILQINHPVEYFSPINFRPAIAIGNEVFAISSPINESLYNVMTVGHIARTVQFTEISDYFIADISAYPGSSGGAVYDEKGKVIGVISGAQVGAPCLVFIVPITEIIDFIEKSNGIE